MKTIMLSIRRQHWNNIRKRRKPYELRKTYPRDGAPFRVLCCITGSGGEVAGEFIVTAIVSAEGVSEERVASWACIWPEEARAYLEKGRVYAFKIGKVIDYALPGRGGVKHLTDYGLTRAPQSWCYVNGEART